MLLTGGLVSKEATVLFERNNGMRKLVTNIAFAMITSTAFCAAIAHFALDARTGDSRG